jgi:hypothetical protein
MNLNLENMSEVQKYYQSENYQPPVERKDNKEHVMAFLILI